MPFRDGTGPQGQGPMTGRGFGPCGGGMSFGRGRGMGREFRFWSRPLTKDEEKQDLQSYKKNLEDELEQVKAEQKKLEEEKGN